MDFTVSADRWMEIKEIEKINKYLDLAGELRKLLKMNVTVVIPVVVGALGTTPKGLKREIQELEIRGRIEII